MSVALTLGFVAAIMFVALPFFGLWMLANGLSLLIYRRLLSRTANLNFARIGGLLWLGAFLLVSWSNH